MKKYTLHWLVLLTIFPFAGNSQSDSIIPTTYEEYIDTYSQIAVNNMKEFGIPASITLAQALLESAGGNSELARYANNHFGIKCHQGWEGDSYHKDDDEKNECFRMYKTPEESFADHALFLTSRSRYAPLFEIDPADYKAWANGLKTAGYATNPAYAERLIGIIEKYELLKFDSDSSISKTRTKVKKRTLAKVKFNNDEARQSNYQQQHPSFPIQKNNGIKYVTAEKNQTLKELADALQIRPWMLRKFNDFPENYEISGGERVYIQSKKRRGSSETHVIRLDETLLSVSQQYGIKLKHLMKINNIKPGEAVKTGFELKLR